MVKVGGENVGMKKPLIAASMSCNTFIREKETILIKGLVGDGSEISL